MATALEIAAAAYRQANLDQDLSSFSMTDFPYSIALDLFNTVIREMNRKGRYWFAESTANLTYSVGVYQYTYASLSVDPNAILRIRKEATDKWEELTQMNWRKFQEYYRRSAIQTTEPKYWSKYNGQIELNCIPDQDYTIKVYHLRDLPLIAATTDTLLCQVSDEDVFQEGIYAYLLNRLSRADWITAYQTYINKVDSLLADMKEDVGLPRQMPAAF